MGPSHGFIHPAVPIGRERNVYYGAYEPHRCSIKREVTRREILTIGLRDTLTTKYVASQNSFRPRLLKGVPSSEYLRGVAYLCGSPKLRTQLRGSPCILPLNVRPPELES